VEIQRLARFTPEAVKELEPERTPPIDRLQNGILNSISCVGVQDDCVDATHARRPQSHQGRTSLVCRLCKFIMAHTPLAWPNNSVLDCQPFTPTERFLRLSRTCLVEWGAYSDVPLDGDRVYTLGETGALLSLLPEARSRWQRLALQTETARS